MRARGLTLEAFRIPWLVYNLRYPGQYYDSETGLNYNYFRDYDAASGRYAEGDPIGLKAGIYSAYSYAGADRGKAMTPYSLGFHWASPDSRELTYEHLRYDHTARRGPLFRPCLRVAAALMRTPWFIRQNRDASFQCMSTVGKLLFTLGLAGMSGCHLQSGAPHALSGGVFSDIPSVAVLTLATPHDGGAASADSYGAYSTLSGCQDMRSYYLRADPAKFGRPGVDFVCLMTAYDPSLSEIAGGQHASATVR